MNESLKKMKDIFFNNGTMRVLSILVFSISLRALQIFIKYFIVFFSKKKNLYQNKV